MPTNIRKRRLVSILIPPLARDDECDRGRTQVEQFVVDDHDVAAALLGRTLGVEIGQLAFVFLILLVHRSMKVLEFRWPHWVDFAPGYAIGSLGAYWTIQRTVMML